KPVPSRFQTQSCWADGTASPAMERRTFITMLASGLLAPPLAAEAQQARKVWRIGLIGVSPRKDQNALVQGLRELGYVEGGNLAIERRYSRDRTDRPSLCRTTGFVERLHHGGWRPRSRRREVGRKEADRSPCMPCSVPG